MVLLGLQSSSLEHQSHRLQAVVVYFAGLFEERKNAPTMQVRGGTFSSKTGELKVDAEIKSNYVDTSLFNQVAYLCGLHVGLLTFPTGFSAYASMDPAQYQNLYDSKALGARIEALKAVLGGRRKEALEMLRAGFPLRSQKEANERNTDHLRRWAFWKDDHLVALLEGDFEAYEGRLAWWMTEFDKQSRKLGSAQQ